MPEPSASFPEKVGRYDLLLPIAAGGMATVYLARAQGIGGFEREVALKLTHAHLRKNATFAGDLIEEAKLAARIRHPNVVQVLDVGDDACGIYLVMEYVEGESLGALVRHAAERNLRVPLGVGLRILVDALGGLHAAHELKDVGGKPIGLVHRDFSPQNILVDTGGRAQLADFGVAKAATRPGQTIAGFVKGKVAYMSPEQGRGLSLDRTCDVWAGAVIAWELATGRRLVPPGNDTDRLLKVVTEEPPRVRTVAPELPPALEEAIARALHMDARRRTPTAAAFAKELTQAMAAAGGLADVEEVAAFLHDISGGPLEERRERVQAVLRQRATAFARLDELPTADEAPGRIRDPTSDATTHLLELAPSAPEPAREPTPPPVLAAPPAVIAPISGSLPRIGPGEPGPGDVPTKPDKPPGDVAAAALGLGEGMTDAVSTSFLGREQLAAPASRRLGVIVVGALVVGAAAAVVLLRVALGGSSSDATAEHAAVDASGRREAAAAPSPARTESARAMAAPSAPAAVSAAPAAAALPADPAELGESVTVHANAPIATLTIDGHDVKLEEPTPEIAVPIGAKAGEVRVEARSPDGRKAAAVLAKGATRLELRFPGARGGASGAGAAKRPGLASSPYEKKP